MNERLSELIGEFYKKIRVAKKAAEGLIELGTKIRKTLEEIEEEMRAVEVIETNSTEPRKRGRKAMGLEERQQVSERMRRYWEERRQAR